MAEENTPRKNVTRERIKSEIKGAADKVRKESGQKEATRQTKAFSKAVDKHTKGKKIKKLQKKTMENNKPGIRATNKNLT